MSSENGSNRKSAGRPPRGERERPYGLAASQRARRAGDPFAALVEDPDETVADVELEAVLDRPEAVPEALPGAVDPEAGRMDAASPLQTARAAVRTPFGRVLMAIPLALAGVALVIMAVTFQTWPYIAGAAVLAPAGLGLLYVRYQRWLGHKRYMFRLLESLGEDVSGFDVASSDRRVKTKRRAQRR